eukprot:COSAG06_NODE_43950_length_367_cov_1.156716_1_plen_47_part_01
MILGKLFKVFWRSPPRATESDQTLAAPATHDANKPRFRVVIEVWILP